MIYVIFLPTLLNWAILQVNYPEVYYLLLIRESRYFRQKLRPTLISVTTFFVGRLNSIEIIQFEISFLIGFLRKLTTEMISRYNPHIYSKFTHIGSIVKLLIRACVSSIVKELLKVLKTFSTVHNLLLLILINLWELTRITTPIIIHNCNQLSYFLDSIYLIDYNIKELNSKHPLMVTQ